MDQKKRDVFAAQMQKTTQAYNAQQAKEEQRAQRRKLLARVRKWCFLGLLVAGAALAVVYREQVATRLVAIFRGDNGAAESTEPANLPYVGTFNRAKQTIGKVQSVQDAQEKQLDDVTPKKPHPDQNR